MAIEGRRLTHLENAVDFLMGLNERVVELLAKQEERLARSEERLDKLDRRLALAEERLEETRRDAQQNQRLWTRLARKHGWLDDEDMDEEV